MSKLKWQNSTLIAQSVKEVFVYTTEVGETPLLSRNTNYRFWNNVGSQNVLLFIFFECNWLVNYDETETELCIWP